MVTNLLNLPVLKRDTGKILSPDKHGISQTDIQIFQKRAAAPDLYNVLGAYGAFPQFSLVIGLSGDGLPFMLDLDNPKSGSILVVGETGCGKTRLLNVVGQSACALNTPQDVSLFVISNRAHEFGGLLNYPHCQGLVAPYDREAGELIIELASIAEQRRTGRELGSKILLVIDDFSSISQILNDYSVHLNFKTLITQGSKSGIWPIVSINPNAVQEEKYRLLRTFGTYIFERSSNQPQLMTPQNGGYDSIAAYTPTFDVIIGGSLNPIINLAV
jgi:hypothetical protein